MASQDGAPGFQEVVQKVSGFFHALDFIPCCLHWDPFSKLLELTSRLGWSFLSADRVLDHWQVEWSLLKAPWHWCEERLLDAGIGLWAYRSFARTLSSLGKAQLSAISIGCYIDNSKFGKYDLALDRLCQCCQCPDTLEHWFSCHLLVSVNGPFRATFPDWDSWPRCFRNHVLLPHATLVTELAAYFDDLPDRTVEYMARPGPGMRHSRVAYSAWAAVSATSGQIISGAPLHGPCRSIGRAELTALVSTEHRQMGAVGATS